MVTKNEILERQQSEQNPLFMILQGATMRLEGTLDILDQALSDRKASKESLEWLDECRAFIDEMAVAKLFDPVILKVQRPVSATPGFENLVLVYDEDRGINTQLTMEDPNLMEMFGPDFKMFVRARLWANGMLQLVARTEDYPW